jgi:hypothetical protein
MQAREDDERSKLTEADFAAGRVAAPCWNHDPFRP